MTTTRTYDQLIQDALSRGVRQITPQQAQAWRTAARSGGMTGAGKPAKPVHVLDIREADELAAGGWIPGAVHVSRGRLESQVTAQVPERDDTVLLVCHSGRRSILAADVLSTMGYSDVHSVSGGMVGWIKEGLPVQGGSTSSVASSASVAEASDSASCTAGLIPGAEPTLSWEEVRREFPITERLVPVRGQGRVPLVYLDHAASTHAPSRVIKRFCTFMANEYANIHRGTHLLSREATKLFDACYHTVANFIGGNLQDDCVVFTTNTTEAIDLCSHVMHGVPGHVVISEMEHHSNDLPHRKRGDVLRARTLDDGSLDMAHLESLLRDHNVKLVAVTGASNITGWISNVHQIARLAHAHGALIMVDGAQLLAHYPIDVRPVGHPEHLDFVAAAGHKAYAPFGAAFLYGPRKLMDQAPPYIPGGGTASEVNREGVTFVASPDRHQGGTPNIGGVIAMAEALRFLSAIGMERIREHEMELIEMAMQGLKNIPGVTIYGPSDPHARLGVLSFNVAGVNDMLAAAVLSEEMGLACRNGRFCSHIYAERLMGLQGGATCEPGAKPGAVRASFGLYNTVDDVQRLIDGVGVLSRHAWVGNYRVKSQEISAEFAARCNDKWMEST